MGIGCLLASKNENFRRKAIEANGEEFGNKVLKRMEIGGYGLLITSLFVFILFFVRIGNIKWPAYPSARREVDQGCLSHSVSNPAVACILPETDLPSDLIVGSNMHCLAESILER
jgi:hypothetical protein